MPVVVIFTKCDALLATAFGKLKPEERKLPREQQLLRMKECVKEMKENNLAREVLTTKRYPPKSYVYLECKYGDLVKCSLVYFICYRHA